MRKFTTIDGDCAVLPAVMMSIDPLPDDPASLKRLLLAREEELVSARARKPRSPIEQLTTREREILAEIASGKSNVAIASSLFLSERAIEKHSNSIFSKLGLSQEPDVNRRVKAVLLYLAAERGVLA